MNDIETPFLNYQRQKICDEVQNKADFDALIEQSELFTLLKEVRGEYNGSVLKTIEKHPRIDRVLLPTDRLLQQGWQHGNIGVEIKADDKNFGKVWTQILDYRMTVWKLDSPVLSFVFAYPFEKQHGTISSMMAHTRTGTVTRRYGGLQFNCGEHIVLRCGTQFDKIGGEATTCIGMKVGSR